MPKKVKDLVRPMGFDTFISEGKRKNWILPFAEDLKGKTFEHDFVWVIDEVPDEFYTEEDRRYNVRLGYCFDKKKQTKVLVNKLFIEQCVILKDVE